MMGFMEDSAAFKMWADGEIKARKEGLPGRLRANRLSAIEGLSGAVEGLLRAARSGDEKALVEYMTTNGFAPDEIAVLILLGDRIETLEKEMPRM